MKLKILDLDKIELRNWKLELGAKHNLCKSV
jgi:hypothetical protein